MARKMLVADLLCGAGGSSTGAKRALTEMGLEMELVCVNHWQVAIDTHERNMPEARHYVQDIATVRPHLLVPEGYLDLLMASPTCTHHSVARGGKPTSDQQRSDPWHIITWLTELRVKRIIIENVWEFTSWGPVNHQTGKPVRSRRGEYFHAWIETLKRLGFDPEWRKLNAADYGDATTRSRFILMARSDQKRVHWPMPSHKKRDEVNVDLFSGAKPWKPAREIIDWDIKGRSIFNRKKDLAPKTLARIYAGAQKFGWPEPYLVILRNHMSAQGMDQPLPTIAAGGNHIGIAEPVIVNLKGQSTASSQNEPLPTQTAHAGHLYSAEPVVVNMKKATSPGSAGDPLPTLTSHSSHMAVAEPIIMNGRKGNVAVGVTEGLIPTLDTKGGVWLAEPSIVEPFVLSQASGGAPRAASQPLPTITTGGQRGSGTALISPYYGSGSGETCNSVDECLPTITAIARFGMVVPVTNSNGGALARNIDVDPLPTMTTAKGGEFAAVIPVTHAGGHDRVSDINAPLPTVTGANRGELSLIEAAPEYDILFRMLEPHELAAAMGFNDEEVTYEFAGTKTQKIKQIGNAVSVKKMKACVGALMADAAPAKRSIPDVDFLEAAE
ncbi:DNA cytosine methyltransferase [Rhizobium sp. VS19-DR104.2]|uniref:DNA cytosine methyltransferase n=1 Tax=unclassified Rhizobium TaxID=2613769 RepID=UPI001CC78FE2|nr:MULTISPECIES: DNA cytosine methyltransferase [unclassified Rhizobium]MBZ5761562.1 DNA cytosine methyltransferase [Rhizobium sp. VS19-DR96]MBZ5767510.1 DNA cytosine methyltransferase [Rhizobium sp. VS19-DR129.2]MBZ5775041.1 DNA cytosine methyltransferase [Rhizobium sp. VS19-DRK62.2]MBZ5785994.1 DNA cytosine methyltransferase [Rhizobium sp. VS19-DR121]MBZ5803420.1 DNA cytosine methyltransferase [Rhizobium sp. VS19-DR181]